jgi:hypothetical protein
MEEWTRWEPVKDISERYYIDFFGMVGDEWDFVIKLSNSDKTKQIEIRFEGVVTSYRYTNESYCFGIFGDLSKKHGDDFYSNWSFFKINKSNYVKWIIDESYDSGFIHFCIVGGDEMLDVIATYEPEIKIIK